MNNWRASGRPQTNPKKKLKKLKQWNSANKRLTTKLKKGLNQDSERGLFYWKLYIISFNVGYNRRVLN